MDTTISVSEVMAMSPSGCVKMRSASDSFCQVLEARFGAVFRYSHSYDVEIIRNNSSAQIWHRNPQISTPNLVGFGAVFGAIFLSVPSSHHPFLVPIITNANVNVIDACLSLHNFIVDWRENTSSTSDEWEHAIFDEDSRRYYAVNPDIEEGIFGGEADERRDLNGNKLTRGRRKTAEVQWTEHGKKWRDAIKDEIARQRLICPESNWLV